ncbi:Ig-like domain-containing protein [Paraflavitalea speifideaquila]|uniref:Ig-like domain-containing protein n=1 Tax=Paraflavitalea speifideaquila TaxID=3076558 RepID=UPI0028EF7ADE|nr:Ig-like domain-containing protein [Paraflavitalea speifideiaquila]
MITGEPTFAQTYLRTQQIQTSTTAIRVYSSKDTTKYGDSVTFTAIVARKFSISKEVLTGSVEFTVDGKDFEQVKLDASGNATLTTASLTKGQHQIAAKFIPASGSTVFASSSLDVTHIVIGDTGAGSVLHQWWFWLIVLFIIISIVAALRRKKKNP